MEPQSPAPEKSSDTDTIEVLGSTLMIIQFLLLGVLAFGDIGFDHPGRYGLSYGHRIVFLALWFISLVGTILCIVFVKTRSSREKEGTPTPDSEEDIPAADASDTSDAKKSEK